MLKFRLCTNKSWMLIVCSVFFFFFFLIFFENCSSGIYGVFDLLTNLNATSLKYILHDLPNK
jgi:hypothetical protein